MAAILLALIAASANAVSALDVFVEENDPSLVYTPFIGSWDHFSNPILGNANYFHGGSCVAIKQPGATVSLTFNGSYIAYYGDLMDNHGLMEVTLDGGSPTQFSTFNAAGGVPQKLLFEARVDPNVPNHVITLKCLENKNMPLDYFMFTAANPVPPPTVSQTSPSPNPTPPSRGNSAASTTSSNTPTIVAGVMAGIGWALALACAFLLWRVRRGNQRAAQKFDFETAPDRPATMTPWTMPLPSESYAPSTALSTSAVMSPTPAEAPESMRPTVTGKPRMASLDATSATAAATSARMSQVGPPAYQASQ